MSRSLSLLGLACLVAVLARCAVYDDDEPQQASCGDYGPCPANGECLDDPVNGWECVPIACNSCPQADNCDWDNNGNVTCVAPDGGEDAGPSGEDAAVDAWIVVGDAGDAAAATDGGSAGDGGDAGDDASNVGDAGAVDSGAG